MESHPIIIYAKYLLHAGETFVCHVSAASHAGTAATGPCTCLFVVALP